MARGVCKGALESTQGGSGGASEALIFMLSLEVCSRAEVGSTEMQAGALEA